MPKAKSKFQIRLELLAARTIIGGLGMLPYRASLATGKHLLRLILNLFPRLKQTAFRNLEIAMPENTEAQNRAIVRGTFESIGRHLGFLSHFKNFELEDIRRLVDVHGMEHFYEAKKTGRGILFITGHFGSWEVFNLLPPAFDEHINILVRRIDNEPIEEYIDSMRTKFGSVTLGKRQAPRKLYRLLNEGKIVGILADLNAQLHDGVFVDFFGVSAATTKSIAKLAIKTNPIILPAFAVWNEQEKKYSVHLEPPVEYELTGDNEKDILEITRKFTSIIEEYVRKYPEQWLWIHKRWNTRPPNEPGLY